MLKLSHLVRFVAVTALVALGLAFARAPASAAITCARVTDNAGVLDENRIKDIKRADVHIITFTSVKGTDLDRAVFKEREKCSNWQGANGSWGADDIVIALSVEDTRSGIYYGAGHEARLGSGRYERARVAMGGHFAEGNFTAGINAGISKVESLLKRRAPRQDYFDDPIQEYPPGFLMDEGEQSDPVDAPW